jgi:hypothetical protein
MSLSGSGLGISAGVPGFRVGTGPRGNYVRVGLGGVSYRATGRGAARHAAPRAAMPSPSTTPTVALVPMEDATRLPVQDLQPTDADDLVEQLRVASGRKALWPWVAAVVILLTAALGAIGIAVLVIGIPLVAWMRLRDKARKSVVVFYDVTDAPAARFEGLVQLMQVPASSAKVWLLEQSGQVRSTYQFKTNSGASAIVDRSSGSAATSTSPRPLVTNVPVPTLQSGRHSVHFLPDRLLVREGKTWYGLPYTALSVTGSTQRFIESGSVPADSRQVDTTWQYVNVRGGPDRRYKDNRQLPVLEYGRLTLSSPTGLYLAWDFSKQEAAHVLSSGLNAMS